MKWRKHTLLETNIDVENPLFVDPAPMKNHGFSTSMLQEGTKVTKRTMADGGWIKPVFMEF